MKDVLEGLIMRTVGHLNVTLTSQVRVCRACHRVSGVKVPVPGVSGAEGKEKGKGVIVRWGLKEAQSESAGRRI
jgi:hypothetical protein